MDLMHTVSAHNVSLYKRVLKEYTHILLTLLTTFVSPLRCNTLCVFVKSTLLKIWFKRNHKCSV